LLVGFNRRFSPLVGELKASLPTGVPRSIMLRVNAGALAATHWTSDPLVGGGRIVGELCHFLDLACHLAEGPPVRVSAEALGAAAALELNDSVAVQVAFACGSVATIQYLANGDPSVAKERLEVFCGGAIALIDDFRSLTLARDGKSRKTKPRRQEKGHREEVQAFVDLAAGKESETLSPTAIFFSSALTLQVPHALASGLPVQVSLPQALGGDGAGFEPAPVVEPEYAGQAASESEAS
jgi:predicted dehydrogenase